MDLAEVNPERLSFFPQNTMGLYDDSVALCMFICRQVGIKNNNWGIIGHRKDIVSSVPCQLNMFLHIDMLHFSPDIVIPGYDSLYWVSHHVYINRHLNVIPGNKIV